MHVLLDVRHTCSDVGGAHECLLQVWNQKVSGFTTHTFDSEFKTLTTNFVGTDGSTLKSFTVTKASSAERIRSTC